MEPSPPSCLLCSSTRGRVLGQVEPHELAAGYRQPHLDVDIGRLLPASAMSLWHCPSCDLRWFDPAPAGDPAFYESLQRHAWYYEADKPEYGQAVQSVPAGARVLEVGCGRGAFADLLRARRGAVTYRGLEFNEAAVRGAVAAGHDVHRASLMEEAARHPGAYDVVCHFQVLEHVPDPLRFMQQSVAALRPGGSLLWAVPADDSYVGHQRDAWLNMPPHHLTRWSDAALGQLCRRVGLEPPSLWHEPVAPAHRTDQSATLAQVAWRSLGLAPDRPGLREDPAVRWVRRLDRLGIVGRAAVRQLAARGAGLTGWGRRGHSVLAVARKPAAADA